MIMLKLVINALFRVFQVLKVIETYWVRQTAKPLFAVLLVHSVLNEFVLNETDKCIKAQSSSQGSFYRVLGYIS